MYLLDRLFGESARVAAPAVPEYTKGQKNCLKLAALLRDRSQWPQGFVWDFSYYKSCAMGLWWASAVGFEGMVQQHDAIVGWTEGSLAFDLGGAEAGAIFGIDRLSRVSAGQTGTEPEDVAADLEAAVAKGIA